MTIEESSIRRRVYGPDEEELSQDFYTRKHTIEDRLPINNTLFRQMERKYKNKSNKLIDMSEVLDFQNPTINAHYSSRIKLEKILKRKDLKLEFEDKENFANNNNNTSNDNIMEEGENDLLHVYSVADIPGFYFIPSAIKNYKYWIKRTFEDYIDNTTNLDAIYDFEATRSNLYELYSSSLSFSSLKEKDNNHNKNDNDDNKNCQNVNLYNIKNQKMESVDIEQTIKKLRWSILGFEYDWTTKEYDFKKKFKSFPQDLADYTTRLVSELGFPNYRPEAGIVNYYQLDDTLTGHVDRSEPNMEAPLVSISFGNSAIFLLGGSNRDNPVTPIIVRNGDISILSGPCRQYYHGIPKILNETTIKMNEFDNNSNNFPPFMNLIRDSRININIRQVY